jgi:hypothetical protein
LAVAAELHSVGPDGIEKAKRLKIETATDRGRLTLRLIGRLQAEHIAELMSQIEASGTERVCLKEVTLVDVDVVRFLAACEDGGISIVNCPAYISEWMNRERQQTD